MPVIYSGILYSIYLHSHQPADPNSNYQTTPSNSNIQYICEKTPNPRSLDQMHNASMYRHALFIATIDIKNIFNKRDSFLLYPDKLIRYIDSGNFNFWIDAGHISHP